MRTVVALVLVVILAGACSASRSPTTPSGTTGGTVVNLAGTWAGSLASANFATRTVTLTVVQGGNCVDGAWTSGPSDWTGAISGFAGANSFTGQISFERTADAGGKCTASGAVSGDASQDSLRWTSDGVQPIGACTGDVPTGIVLTLRRTGS